MNRLDKYKLLLFILPLLLSSCSNDTNNNPKDPAEQFSPTGVYVGTMKINKGDGSFEATLTDQLVFVEQTNDQNTIRLSVKDFMVNDIEFGNVAMPAVYEKRKDGVYDLDGYVGLLPIGVLGETTLSLVGTLTQEHELSFAIDGLIEESNEKLTVSFDGEITDIVLQDYYFDFENWQVMNPTAPSDMRYSLPISNIIGFNWASTDAEVYRFMGIDYINQFTVGSNSEGWGDQLSVQIRTIESNEGMNELLFPKIYSGLFYLGSFVDKVTPSHEGILLGVPFSNEPLSIKGGLRYKPGGVFYRCPNPNQPATVVETDETDACLIEAFLYKVNLEENQGKLNLDNIYTSDRVVASGSYSTDRVIDSFEEFEFTFKWNEGETYNPEQQYQFVILATSSKEGRSYSGAPGSTLLIDNLQVSTKR